MIKRYIEKHILNDLKNKMVFISGPRQVGKTTLAKQLGNKFFPGKYAYLNWDASDDRSNIIKNIMPADKDLLIFDEIHKYRDWKTYLKGQYDKHKEEFKILVTGSARLDIYKKGGDSLLGRYHSYRLHPLSLNELMDKEVHYNPLDKLTFHEEARKKKDLFHDLLKFGGFPEIFIMRDEKTLRRWHNERVDRLVREDIRDIENVRDISLLQVLTKLLPEKVGSLLSLNSLREDLGVNHKTVAQWVDIFERFYYHFRIYPYQSTLIKSLRKEPKLYLWDWSEIIDEDIRFENMVASHLLKFSHFLYDVEGYKTQLYYLRDKEQREVDFLLTVNNRPWFAVEAKNKFKEIPAPLKYFERKLKIPFSYLVIKENGVDVMKDGIRAISADKFLTALV